MKKIFLSVLILVAFVLLVGCTGMTPLMSAAKSGDITIAKDLLDKGADVNAKNTRGSTALMWAIEGHTEIVKLLLDKGADVNAKNINGATALLYAVLKGHADVVKLLLDKGADVNAKYADGETVLMWATINGHTEIVKLLLDKGADVNAKYADGFTVLMWATIKGHTEIVKLLLDKGVDVNAINTSGTTALAHAVGKGHTGIVKLLLAKGADVNVKIYGSTALILAAEAGHTGIVKLLLAKDADVNAKNPEGATALMWAAKKGHVEIIKLLLSRGADIDSAIAASEAKAAQYPDWMAAAKLLAKYAPRKVGQTTATVSISNNEAQPSLVVKSDIDEFPTIKAKPNKNSFAIVIGIENYRQKLPKADFSTSDAKLITEYLTKVLGYPEENVVTLVNDRAALGDFVKYFEKWLPNNVEKGSTVFVYYSGHGAPDPKSGSAYLVPYDGDPSFIDETGYSLKRMYAALGKLPAKEVIVALDSCFSGAGGRSVIAKGSRPLVMNLQSNVVLPKNMTVLSASSGDQTSSTYDEKGHGLFTYFMLKGIKNEDVTRPDGSLKIDDLYSYIKPQVERIARKQYNNEQTPQLIERAKR